MTADGNGNLTFEGKKNQDGVYGESQFSCTYDIEESGFGTITCPGRTFHIILSDEGKAFDAITEGGVLSGHFPRQ